MGLPKARSKDKTELLSSTINFVKIIFISDERSASKSATEINEGSHVAKSIHSPKHVKWEELLSD